MFSRILEMQVKPGQISEFTKNLDSTVIPQLRKQHGFQNILLFSNTDESTVTSVTVWDRKESAETYVTKGYPQVLQSLTPYITGTPSSTSSHVIYSTFDKTPVTV